MSAATKRRLEALEAGAARIEDDPPLFVELLRFSDSPDRLDDGPTGARIGDEVLTRAIGESVVDFEGHAQAEASRQRGKGTASGRLVVMFTGEPRSAATLTTA